MLLLTCMKSSALNSGFTLIELIVAVAIITSLAALAVPGLGSYLTGQNLTQSLEQVKSDLRTAQNNALTGTLASEDVGYWGVDFELGNSLYEYVTYDESGVFDRLHGGNEGLVGDVEVKNSIVIVFEEFTGEAFNATGMTRCAQDGLNCIVVVGEPGASGNECAQILVNTSGAMFKEKGALCP